MHVTNIMHDITCGVPLGSVLVSIPVYYLNDDGLHVLLTPRTHHPWDIVELKLANRTQ